MRTNSTPQILIIEIASEPYGLEKRLKDHGFGLPITSVSEADEAFDYLRQGGKFCHTRELALLLLPGQNMDAALDFIASLRQDEKLKRTILFVLLDKVDSSALARIHDLHVAGCLDTQILQDEPEVFCNFLTRYLNIVKYPRRG